MQLVPILQNAKEKFSAIADKYCLRGESIKVKIGTLTAKQAIGNPVRKDFPLLIGKEVMIEAQFRDSFGQAFTSQPQSFSGSIQDILSLNLDISNNRAIFIATLNAVTAHFGIADKTCHCKTEEPEMCGMEIAQSLLSRFGRIRIGMVGYQPAMLDHLIQTFGTAHVKCSDLDPNNVGSNKFGVVICDGYTENKSLMNWCDLLLVTSSTNVNNTLDDLYTEAISHGKHFITFGITGAGISALSGLERICPFGH